MPLTNVEFADALRKIAEFYEANPEMPQPPEFVVYPGLRTQFLKAVKCLGTFEKLAPEKGDDYWFRIQKDFGGLALIVSTARSEVCRKVVKQVAIEVWECDQPLLEKVAEMEAAAEQKASPYLRIMTEDEEETA